VTASLTKDRGGYLFEIRDEHGKVVAHGWSAGSKRDANAAVEQWKRENDEAPTHDLGGEA
jgi:hypothetical protein